MFRRDDSNKWSNTGFGQELGIIEMKIRTLSGALGSHLIRTCTIQFENLNEILGIKKVDWCKGQFFNAIIPVLSNNMSVNSTHHEKCMFEQLYYIFH